MEREKDLMFRTDYSELNLTGCLNYDIYKNMSKDEMCEFVKRDAEELAKKFVSGEWKDAVHIHSKYSVIDNLYNVRENVKAQLVYIHGMGASGDFKIVKNSKTNITNQIKQKL